MSWWTVSACRNNSYRQPLHRPWIINSPSLLSVLVDRAANINWYHAVLVWVLPCSSLYVHSLMEGLMGKTLAGRASPMQGRESGTGGGRIVVNRKYWLGCAEVTKCQSLCIHYWWLNRLSPILGKHLLRLTLCFWNIICTWIKVSPARKEGEIPQTTPI